ncbi:MAG: hypothetical protein ACXITV_07885 [Luteibaculaceae bacterium]
MNKFFVFTTLYFLFVASATLQASNSETITASKIYIEDFGPGGKKPFKKSKKTFKKNEYPKHEDTKRKSKNKTTVKVKKQSKGKMEKRVKKHKSKIKKTGNRYDKNVTR